MQVLFTREEDPRRLFQDKRRESPLATNLFCSSGRRPRGRFSLVNNSVRNETSKRYYTRDLIEYESSRES